jgi:hypothetical protein
MDDETVAEIMRRTERLIEEGTRREPPEELKEGT